MRRDLTLLSWILLAIAICAWIMAAVFLWLIQSENASYVAGLGDAQITAKQDATAEYVHGVVRDAAGDADELNKILQIDPVAFVKKVQAAGRETGVDIRISSVFPENVSLRTKPKDAPPIYAFGFTVESEGSFASLIRVLRVLETLPAPASIGQIDFDHVGATERAGVPTGPWKITVRVRVLTTTNISS